MKLKKCIAVMLVFSMTVMMITGCGKKNETDNSENNSDNNAVTKAADNTDKDNTDSADLGSYPGTSEKNAITVNLTSEPGDMCTITSTDTVSFDVIRHVIENLVTLDENDEILPGVAKDWTVSDDGLVYTFNLRDDMKWTNGEPVTANDFVFAWTSLLTPEFASEYAYFGYVFKNGRAYNEGKADAKDLGFSALSDYQLEVTLENPLPYFLNTLAFGVLAPVNEKAYNEYGDAYGTDADKIVYNGPFTMTSWDHEDKIILEKNPDYYGADDIQLDKITMVMINDTNAALNAFKAGEVDMVNANGEQADLMRSENYTVSTYDDGSCFYLEYNLKDPQLSNVNLRKAITYGVDKQAFIDAIIKNDSKPSTSFTPPAIKGLNDQFSSEVGELIPAFDADKAKQFYKKALEELGVDTVSLTMIADDSDTAIDNAAFIQEQLKVNLGIDLKVENMPFKSRLDRMTNRDFSIVFAGWGPDYNDPMTFLDMFETGNGNNHTGYSSKEYDALLAKVRKEVNIETRMGYLKDLETLLMEDLPIGPIYWRSRDYLLSGKIESGVIRTAFSEMYFKYVKLKQ